MRLASPSVPAGDPPTLNAELLDQVQDASGRTRSRVIASSSLDYKADGSLKHLITTPGGRPKEKKQTAHTVEQQQEQEPVRRAPYATRARGSSGIPPHRFDLADLEHLSEEELMQVLYHDPELAKAAAAQQQQQQSKKAPPRSSKSGRKRSSSSSSSKSKSSSSSSSHHLQDQMDDGVPVFQWVIVLVLLGAGIYQLRKMLMLPPPKNSRHNKRISGKQHKAPKASKSSKSKGKVTKSEIKTKNNKTVKKAKATPPTKEITKEKSTKKNKNKEPKRTMNGTAAVNGSGNKKEESNKPSPKPQEVATETPQMIEEVDESGWEPLGKNKKANPPSPSVEAPAAVQVQAPPEEEEAEGFQVAGKKKKKKKKANGVAPTPEPVPQYPTSVEETKEAWPGDDDDDADAALAAQLQQQEEEAAAATKKAPPLAGEDWAEVSKKSKRKK